MTTSPVLAAPKSPARRNSAATLASILRELRQNAGLSIGALAKRSGLAQSTLSKIENAQMSPTYETIISLAAGLDVDVSELFAHKPSANVGGRRAVTRKNEGAKLETGTYTYELLCADIANKKFIPLLTRIEAHSFNEFDGLTSHAGEEMIYVLEGSVTLHTDLYAPTMLDAGDCCYFDSMMGHAIVSTSEDPATILWICSTVVSPVFG
ncbi:XRE family transcriptional regulator [Acetobacteraceae bacterium KSS8]|uniref:XRE family transcriptional regulator n=1 Tax=Endosaccharibacter trunci TaxID=2812733 RepID=A0ABT1W7S0_9PROT|nr:XRE family transcriptional regulator [Acetobacteraceae bacterium KSS8]